MIAYKYNRIPLSAKILIELTVEYLSSPIDLIIVPGLIYISIKLIPKIILDDAREKVKSNVRVYKKTNWVFAIVIIINWLILLYFLFKKLNHFWKYVLCKRFSMKTFGKYLLSFFKVRLQRNGYVECK